MLFNFKNRKKSKKEKPVDKEKTDEEYLKLKNIMENKKRYHKMKGDKMAAAPAYYFRGGPNKP